MDSIYWSGLVDQVKQVFRGPADQKPGNNSALLAELQAARKEWDYAKEYFNSVTDPDLIDLAIYYIGVSEKKYVYLLKKARETGTCIERYSYH
ncbi:MAG TPA: YaaL family protein [Bacillota bacterium]|nr:YaaL family protein [Bacillota bacterium]